ncbi:hypothetical protein A2U01_0061915, partial [Trifolium medium]|nr:hypothetical protein [Trifolium medium]
PISINYSSSHLPSLSFANLILKETISPSSQLAPPSTAVPPSTAQAKS